MTPFPYDESSNLLTETIKCLADNGKNPKDVLWIGDASSSCTWDQFAECASFDYDDGYGGQEIYADLVIVGKDFWLERHEYDGSEWWEFKQLPTQPPTGSVKLAHGRKVKND
jgi:hypothetical protein